MTWALSPNRLVKRSLAVSTNTYLVAIAALASPALLRSRLAISYRAASVGRFFSR
jgi:hypothetical protein